MGKERNPDDTDRHHRRPRSQGGGDTEDNISDVRHGDHVAWHRLFKNFGPTAIAAIINSTWLDPAWRFVATPATGFLALLQLAYWYRALERGKDKQNMDGDGI